MEPDYNLLTIVGSHQDNAFGLTLELGTDFKEVVNEWHFGPFLDSKKKIEIFLAIKTNVLFIFDSRK